MRCLNMSKSNECKKVTIPQQAGGVPNYLINLDEVKTAIENTIGNNSPQDNSSGIQRSKGFLILSESYGVEMATWRVPQDIELTGLTFTQEESRNMGYDDYINIFIDDDVLLETVYLKEMQEVKEFRNTITVKEDSIIEVEYVNDTGIQKEFKIDLEYLNRTPMETPQLDTPPVTPDNPIPPKPEPEEPTLPEPMPDLQPIYRIYLRYEGSVATDLDMYVNMFNNQDGSDITPKQTVGFTRRRWGIDLDNMVDMTRVSDSHLGIDAKENEPEIIEIYGTPSSYYRFYVNSYKYGDRLTENVTIEMFQVDSNGKDALLLHSISKNSQRFSQDNAKVFFFDFDISNQKIVEL